MKEMVGLAEKLELMNNYAKIAREYGLFARKVTFTKSGAESKEYFVFSLNEIPENVNPLEIIKRNRRYDNIFYPESFAIERNAGNPMGMWGKIANYAAHAEFIYEVYEEYGVPWPKAIRTDELESLENFYCKSRNKAFDIETRRDYLNGLRNYFEGEKFSSKKAFRRKWHDFYRSGLFDGEKTFLGNFLVFLQRDRLQAARDASLEAGSDIKKVYMAEHRYQKFKKIMQARYPRVEYSVGKKEVVDKGILIDPETGERAETAYGITVTDEEYDWIIEKHFDTQGFACIDKLNPSIFVGRDVFYNASDESIIASVSREVSLSWAKCPDWDTLMANGPVRFVDIPADHMMNFYAQMRVCRIPFLIDYDVSSSPNFATLRIVYNVRNEKIVQNTLIGLSMAEVDLAHVVMNNENSMFDIDVRKIEKILQQAYKRRQLN